MITIIDLTNFNPEEYMKLHKKDRKRRDYRIKPQEICPVTFTENYKTSPIGFIQENIINQDYFDIMPNYYIINNYGQVRTIDGTMIQPKLINSGYNVYYLKSRLGTLRPYTIHRLVLMSFNPVPNMDSLTVDHINGNKLDNRLSNLRWCTQEENNVYRSRQHKTDGIYNYNSHFTMEQLETIVDELDSYTNYSVILDMIGLPNTKNNRDYIGNINRGITYKNEVAEIRENKVQRLSKG